MKKRMRRTDMYRVHLKLNEWEGGLGWVKWLENMPIISF
jgi:hypothetical protein